jgi:acylphosphatase
MQAFFSAGSIKMCYDGSSIAVPSLLKGGRHAMSTADDDVTLTALVTGAVQGVGFRVFAQRQAAALGLRGWVRNRPDGAVEVVAQGPREAVGQLLAALRRGPRLARVDQVNEDWSPRDDIPATFLIKD